MLQKLILLVISVIFITGCGAAADRAPVENNQPDLLRAEGAADQKTDAESSETVAATDPESVPETVSNAEYFLFTTTNSTLSGDDGTTLRYENQCIATFTSSDQERESWVTEILQRIEQAFQTDSHNLYEYAQDFIAENGTEYFYSYSNYQQIGAARHDKKIVSLISLNSLYSGGSHPNSVQVAYNLDIENRRILRLEDVIKEGSTPTLAELVRAEVDSKFAFIDGGNGLFDDYLDTIHNSMDYGNMTPYWYLNDTGLVIFYNQYELGPYAAGIIKVELPYDTLGDILLDEFYPMEPDGTQGDLFLQADPGGSIIPITIEKDGQSLLVGVEGTVYQVQLSEVFWLENTPIAQNLLFSAMSLEEHDVLQITGGYTDENRSFAIEFVNGSGEQYLYYIHNGELSSDP